MASLIRSEFCLPANGWVSWIQALFISCTSPISPWKQDEGKGLFHEAVQWLCSSPQASFLTWGSFMIPAPPKHFYTSLFHWLNPESLMIYLIWGVLLIRPQHRGRPLRESCYHQKRDTLLIILSTQHRAGFSSQRTFPNQMNIVVPIVSS